MSALFAGGAFAAIAYLGRRLNPWAGGVSLRAPAEPVGASGSWWRRTLRASILVVVSIAITLGLWVAAIDVLELPPYVARYPSDVWAFFFSVPEAAVNRSEVLDALWITVHDALLGFLIGTTVAIALAIVLVSSDTVRRIMMPMAVALQCIPVIAITPIIVLGFGRDLLATLVIAGLATFFPTLINVMAGLRSTPPQSVELLESYGASRLTVLRKVQIPSALPSVFAAARIAAPAALLGVIVAEWLATGEGIGSTMVVDALTGRYDAAWAAGVVVTITSVCFYALAGMVERPVLARYAPEQVR